MRTSKEIAAYIDTNTDLFGTSAADLSFYCEFDDVRHLFREEYVADVEAGNKAWEVRDIDTDAVLARMAEYFPFACEKCAGERGLSSIRSIAHFRGWSWLIGHDDVHRMLSDNELYEPYGAPMLARLADYYGWDCEDLQEVRRMAGEE